MNSDAGYGWPRFGPALAAAAGTFALGRQLPAWLYMWTLAIALFAGVKWITIVPRLGELKSRRGRLALYVFAWPGLDAAAFCGEAKVQAPARREWMAAAIKMGLGLCLIYTASPSLIEHYPLAAGWMGMIGLALLLHFGLFHALSNLLREVGVNAKPLMRAPAAAASLRSFWGERWNTGFSDLIGRNLLIPLTRRFGGVPALLIVFVLSGFLHELVITVPARGGYGLPTIYFTLQALGILAERSRTGRRLGLGNGWRGWLFMAGVAGLPLGLLFPPVFVRNVILPMLHGLGAIQGTL